MKSFNLVMLAVLVTSFTMTSGIVLAAGDDNPFTITSVPRDMSYQGILKDSGGDPVTDSIYTVTFRIYNIESGGSSLWDQTLPCTTSAGYFNAIFSNVNLPFNEDYWLELEIDSEILDPRQKMSMVGYAAVSDTADYAFATAAGGDGWVDDGTVIRLDTSTDSVGIGITDPEAKLHVHDFNSGNKGYLASSDYGAYGRNNSNGSYGYLGGISGYGVLGSGSTAGVYGIESGSGNFGFLGSSSYGLYARSDAGTAGYFYGNVQITEDLYTVGNVGIGQPAPDEKLHIIGNIKIEDGNQGSGKVLTSDVNGVGTWQDAVGSHWNVNDSILYTNSLWGLSRGGAGNAAYDDSVHTIVNWGVACTTGVYLFGNHAVTIGGGLGNVASSDYTTVSGGMENRATGKGNVICGGIANETHNLYTTICGGNNNYVGGNYATAGVICGGMDNAVLKQVSFIGGGSENKILEEAAWSCIVGGEDNSVNGYRSFIGGGLENGIFTGANYSTIAGGLRNEMGAWYATIGGGSYNDVFGRQGGVFCGNGNVAGDSTIDTCAFVGGGAGNEALSEYSVISGGRSNSVEGGYSCIVGGHSNNIASGADYSYLFGIDSDLTEDSTFMVDLPHIHFGDEINGYEFPPNDGSAGQVMVTDGNGQLSWSSNIAIGSSQLSDLYEIIQRQNEQIAQLERRLIELEQANR